MRLFIDMPRGGGEGVYVLMTEDGEELASHFCSNASFARGDLESRRPERQTEWRERFGEYTVEFADQAMHDKLVRQAWQRFHDANHDGDADEQARCPICAELPLRAEERP